MSLKCEYFGKQFIFRVSGLVDDKLLNVKVTAEFVEVGAWCVTLSEHNEKHRRRIINAFERAVREQPELGIKMWEYTIEGVSGKTHYM